MHFGQKLRPKTSARNFGTIFDIITVVVFEADGVRIRVRGQRRVVPNVSAMRVWTVLARTGGLIQPALRARRMRRVCLIINHD
jgi:hypothetical protein